jgi:transcription initiation factor TFIIIB Brf1 subunit/transcription initiation factor TFIIB
MSVCPRCGHDETDHGIVTGCTVCRCSGLVPVEGDADFDATAPDYRRTADAAWEAPSPAPPSQNPTTTTGR